MHVTVEVLNYSFICDNEELRLT